MKLRKLQKEDAPLMLEWMHDYEIVADLKADFASKTLADCQRFIISAQDTSRDLHLAATDNTGTYMGTVSLKHIHSDWAEFAIVMRKSAMGRGISRDAMAEILQYGIKNMKLHQIYWCVSKTNARAVHFYDKNHYMRTRRIPPELEEMYSGEVSQLLWYVYA